MATWRWGVERSMLGFLKSDMYQSNIIDAKAVAAEFVGSFILVAIGCGSVTAHGWSDAQARLAVAFAFGMSVMVLSYTMGHHSGANLNFSVTFSLVLGGHMHWYQGLANGVAQLSAGILGACLVAIMFPCQSDLSHTLGSNQIFNPAYDPLRVLVGECVCTFIVCFVVWQTAVTPQTGSRKNACLAIGFTVFAVHLMLLPIDGASANPTRSFGPAMVAYARGCDNYIEGAMKDHWIFWIGPLFGAAAAAGLQLYFAPTTSELKQLEALEEEWIKVTQLLEVPQDNLEKESNLSKDVFDNIEPVEKSADENASNILMFGKCLNVF
jgi:MIP family channel proteins